MKGSFTCGNLTMFCFSGAFLKFFVHLRCRWIPGCKNCTSCFNKCLVGSKAFEKGRGVYPIYAKMYKTSARKLSGKP